MELVVMEVVVIEVVVMEVVAIEVVVMDVVDFSRNGQVRMREVVAAAARCCSLAYTSGRREANGTIGEVIYSTR